VCAHVGFKVPLSRSCKASSSVFRYLCPSVIGATRAHVHAYIYVEAKLIVSPRVRVRVTRDRQECHLERCTASISHSAMHIAS
jgi:hypothetical protein